MSRYVSTKVTFLLCGLFVGALTSSLLAQRLGTDPVEQLRQALKSSTRDLTERDLRVEASVGALRSLGDMRRALGMQEWRDQDPDPRVAKLDSAKRQALAERFQVAVRSILKTGTPGDCLAVINLLGETGAKIRDSTEHRGLASKLGPDLVAVMGRGPAAVTEAAAIALGRINPDPLIAIPPLCQLLTNSTPSGAQAASEALCQLLRTMGELPAPGQNPTGVEATQREVVSTAHLVVPACALGLGCADARVRAKCMEGVAAAANVLHDSIREPSSPEDGAELTAYRQQVEEEWNALRPLMIALRDQSPAIARALTDPETDVRLHARRALEDMARARRQLRARASSGVLPRERKGIENAVYTPQAGAEDPLAEGIAAAVPVLLAGVADGDVRVRRTAVEFLETLEPVSLDVNRALAQMLRDRDRSVRWAAARSLAKLPTLDPESAVPTLAALLLDADLDVGLAAASGLAHYGKAAAPAAAAMLRAADAKDAELRVGALNALQATLSTEATVQARYRSALADEDARVRKAAAQILGRMGESARDAEPALRELLGDSSPDVRKAAGDALANLAQRQGK